MFNITQVKELEYSVYYPKLSISSDLVKFIYEWLLYFDFIFAEFEILGARQSSISLLKSYMFMSMKSIVLDALQSLGVKKDSFMGFWLASATLGEM